MFSSTLSDNTQWMRPAPHYMLRAQQAAGAALPPPVTPVQGRPPMRCQMKATAHPAGTSLFVQQSAWLRQAVLVSNLQNVVCR